MLGMVTLTRSQRLALGLFVLLLVDVIWVASSELNKFIFKDNGKPFFTTYLGVSMCVVYLTGFIFWKPWRQQCFRSNNGFQKLGEDEDKSDLEESLSEPVFVPIKFDERCSTSGESDDGSGSARSVRFSSMSEVRHLSDSYAEEAVMARLSYPAYIKAEEARLRASQKLTIKQVAKLAFLFFLIFFIGKLAYQEAMKDVQPSQQGVVNILASTGALFTLVLTAMFPSNNGDRFTISKLVAVALSIGGVSLVSAIGRGFETQIPLGALWALCSAFLNTFYIVIIRRKGENEDKLDIPMFIGFVGILTLLLLWPGFFILHYTNAELYQWPSRLQWFFFILNGAVSTVVCEVLWLWGCFLTSSLIAVMSLSLLIPLRMIAEVLMTGRSATWLFYVGSIPILVAFFGTSLLAHYENWDPVLLIVKKAFHFICRQRIVKRLRELDREQTEGLISLSSDSRLQIDS